MHKTMQAARTRALARPGTEEGIACEGTPVESRTIKVNGKAFVFLGAENVRLKLSASIGEAQTLGAKEPRVVAGAGGWVKIVLDDAGAPPKSVPLARWIDESYELYAGAKAAAKPAAKPASPSKPARKPAAPKRRPARAR